MIIHKKGILNIKNVICRHEGRSTDPLQRGGRPGAWCRGCWCGCGPWWRGIYSFIFYLNFTMGDVLNYTIQCFFDKVIQCYITCTFILFYLQNHDHQSITLKIQIQLKCNISLNHHHRTTSNTSVSTLTWPRVCTSVWPRRCVASRRPFTHSTIDIFLSTHFLVWFKKNKYSWVVEGWWGFSEYIYLWVEGYI